MKNYKVLDIATETFDNTFDKIEKFVVAMVEDSIEKHKDISEEDKYEAVIDPVLAAFTAVLANYHSQIGYPKGLLLERICDFYLDPEEPEHSKNITIN